MTERLDYSFIFVDKPPNMLSHEMTSWVGRIIGSSKAGHIGTLDPKVTGVMIVGLGKATRLIQFFSNIRKEYVAVIDWQKEVTEDFALAKFSEFKGRIRQMPPEQSAVARRIRERNVYSLDLIEHNGRFSVFRTLVDAGTYIRTLCTDMGGKMSDLRRVSAGPVTEKDCMIMQKIVDAAALYRKGHPRQLERMLVSADKMIDLFGIMKVNVEKASAIKLLDGSQIALPETGLPKGNHVAIYCNDRLAGMAEAVSESKDGTVVKPVRMMSRKEME